MELARASRQQTASLSIGGGHEWLEEHNPCNTRRLTVLRFIVHHHLTLELLHFQGTVGNTSPRARWLSTSEAVLARSPRLSPTITRTSGLLFRIGSPSWAT